MRHGHPTRDPVPSTSRRQPRQARSRQTVDALLTAAAEVFEAEGFDGATTERIVARAGVSIGSMYQYFPNKEALLEGLAERLCGETEVALAELVAALEAGPALEGGVDAFVDFLVRAHAGPRRLRCLLFEQRAPPVQHLSTLHQTTLDALTRWLEGRVERPEAAAMLLQRAVSTLVHQFVLHPTDALPPEQAIAEVRRLALGYLRFG